MSEGTSARRRRVGAQLREWRRAEGLTLQEVADRLEVSLATASRWETGSTKVSLDTYSRLADLYRVDSETRVYFERLCRDADEAGWWMRYSDTISHGFRDFVELESQAVKEFCYGMFAVPGIVQTAEYRRALILMSRHVTYTPQKADLSADMNTARQAILSRAARPFEVHVVLHEAALQDDCAGQPHVMRDQIRRLRELSERPNATIQLVPLRRVMHPGCMSPFTMLTYEDGGATVYHELLATNLMTNAPDEVALHQAAVKELTTEVALSPEQSALRLDELLA